MLRKLFLTEMPTRKVVFDFFVHKWLNGILGVWRSMMNMGVRQKTRVIFNFSPPNQNNIRQMSTYTLWASCVIWFGFGNQWKQTTTRNMAKIEKSKFRGLIKHFFLQKTIAINVNGKKRRWISWNPTHDAIPGTIWKIHNTVLVSILYHHLTMRKLSTTWMHNWLKMHFCNNFEVMYNVVQP